MISCCRQNVTCLFVYGRPVITLIEGLSSCRMIICLCIWGQNGWFLTKFSSYLLTWAIKLSDISCYTSRTNFWHLNLFFLLLINHFSQISVFTICKTSKRDFYDSLSVVYDVVRQHIIKTTIYPKNNSHLMVVVCVWLYLLSCCFNTPPDTEWILLHRKNWGADAPYQLENIFI